MDSSELIYPSYADLLLSKYLTFLFDDFNLHVFFSMYSSSSY